MSATATTPHETPIPSPGSADPGRISTLVDAVTERVRRGLERRLAGYAEQGRSLGEIGPAERLAERMLEVVPEVSHWNDLLGPFYNTRQVARLCGGISRQAVADRRERRTLLALKTADGVLAYPVFQFDRHGEVVTGMVKVLQILAESGADEWTVAGWLVADQEVLGSSSIVDWLSADRDLESALTLAADAARRFAS